MGKRGDSFYNGSAESLFRSLKVELTHGGRHLTWERARQALFERSETYYHSIRRHSALDQINPAAFGMQNAD